jgi:hypothetical protein
MQTRQCWKDCGGGIGWHESLGPRVSPKVAPRRGSLEQAKQDPMDEASRAGYAAGKKRKKEKETQGCPGVVEVR